MDLAQWVEVLGLSFAGGLTAGVLGGMLGMGGGIIIVPIMNYVLPLALVPRASLMHAALVASLSFMTINTLNSAAQHWRVGNLDLKTFVKMGIPVAVGAIIGAALADIASSHLLRVIFCVYIVYNVIMGVMQIVRHKEVPPGTVQVGKLPPQPYVTGLFTGVGTLCSMLGVGVAALITPWMAGRGFSFTQIAAQNSALSAIVAMVGTTSSFAGMVAFIIAGLNEPDMPPYSLGYLYVPAFVALSAGALAGAPFGIRLGKKLSTRTLKWAFLVVVSASFLSMVAKMMAG